jgi:hypothetical protein
MVHGFYRNISYTSRSGNASGQLSCQIGEDPTLITFKLPANSLSPANEIFQLSQSYSLHCCFGACPAVEAEMNFCLSHIRNMPLSSIFESWKQLCKHARATVAEIWHDQRK